MICPRCGVNEVSPHPQFGAVPCGDCQLELAAQESPVSQPEFTTEFVKWQRKAFSKDIIQPFRAGEVSKEYLNQYGTKGIKVTPKQVKKAKEVWK